MSLDRSELDLAWESVMAKAEGLMATVRAMTPEERTTAPPKGLNALDTIKHLSLTDQFEIGLIRKNQPHREKKPGMNFIGRWAVSGMKSAKPVPTIKALLPQTSSTVTDAMVAEAVEEWQMTLDQIGKAIAASSPDKTLFKHPAFGLMGPLDLIVLLDSHLDYHIARLRKAGAPV